MYFSEIGIQISKTVEQEKSKKQTMFFREVFTNKSIFMKPVTNNEISNIIENLKKKSSPGHDNITLNDLLIIKNLVIPILTEIFNNIISNGNFPETLKIGKITPIYKSGDHCDIENYRPITVINTISKILDSYIK